MKSFLASKTIWFNLVTIIVAVATFLGYTPNQELAETVAGLLIVLSPVINLGLRFVTDKAIKLV